MPRRLIELRVYPDTWVLSPSFPERIVYLSYPFNEGMQAVLVAQSRAFYPAVTANTRSYTLKATTDVFRMPVNIWPEEALAFKAIPRDYKQNSGYCRVLIEVEDDLQADPTASIEELQEQVADQAAAIATLEQATTTQASEIASLQQANASQDGAIASLQSSVSTINSTNTAQDSAIASLQSQVAALTANLSWANLTLINNWTNFGTPFGNAQYAKANGWVFLRGVVFGGNSSNALLATLPSGFRPVIRVLVDCASIQTNYAGYAPGRLDVEPNGNISNFGSANFVVSLDGLAFYVGN